MARKKATRSKPATLPKGFQPIGGFATSWPNEETKIGDAIQGIVSGYDEIPVKRGKKTENVELLRLEGNDGRDYTVWRSSGLAALFDEDYTDVEVYIQYNGLGKKKPGQNPPKLFTIGADVE